MNRNLGTAVKSRTAVRMHRSGFKLWAIAAHLNVTENAVAKMLLADGASLLVLAHPFQRRPLTLVKDNENNNLARNV